MRVTIDLDNIGSYGGSKDLVLMEGVLRAAVNAYDTWGREIISLRNDKGGVWFRIDRTDAGYAEYTYFWSDKWMKTMMGRLETLGVLTAAMFDISDGSYRKWYTFTDSLEAMANGQAE